jgi:hypothetical protein
VRAVSAFLGRELFGIPVAAFARLFQKEHSALLHGVLSLERRVRDSHDDRQELMRAEAPIRELSGFQA